MQLNVTTDYAIRMTLFLAILGTPMGSEDISKQMGIPKQMIAQIAKPLRDAGIIATKRGVGGGFSSVSYTHLDVYKRQPILRCSKRRK